MDEERLIMEVQNHSIIYDTSHQVFKDNIRKENAWASIAEVLEVDGFSRTNNEELRVVMVGKTGIGKSATGNTILGQQSFQSKLSAKSMTVECSKAKGTVDGQEVAVIDTPGLFDTRFDQEKTAEDISQCITYASPGPHVFLVVIRLGRYTQEEKETVERIQKIFGQTADRYSMVLFTGGDELEKTGSTIEEFMVGSKDLQELVARCNDQYHVFNNDDNKDRSQVTELLQKIRNMVQKNGGSHYTNEMFQEAERLVEEKKLRILKEKEEQILKEKEELQREIHEKYERAIKKITDELQAVREREREERKKEMEEMKEERQREREERKKEMEEMKEEREREREERKKEMEEMKEERQREREERKKEMEEMKEERQREREERKKEMEEMKEERKTEREEGIAEIMRDREEKERELNKLKEQYDNDLKEQEKRLVSRHEAEARDEAEDSNSFYHLVKAGQEVANVGENVVDIGKNVVSAGIHVVSAGINVVKEFWGIFN